MEKFSNGKEFGKIALEEMKKWGLEDWTLSPTRTVIINGEEKNISTTNIAGHMDPINKDIHISWAHFITNSKGDVITTLRHEIAHALHYLDCVDNNKDYFSEDEHGEEWIQFCQLVEMKYNGSGNNKSAIWKSY